MLSEKLRAVAPTMGAYNLAPTPENVQQWAGEVAQLEQRIEAWREAYLALRAYYSNNNGENSRRKRAATDKLKDMKLK